MLVYIQSTTMASSRENDIAYNVWRGNFYPLGLFYILYATIILHTIQLNCTKAQTANPVWRMLSIIRQVQFWHSRVRGIPSIPLPPRFISHRKWMCVLPCNLIFIHRRSPRRRTLKDHLCPVFPTLPSVSPVMSQSGRVLSYGCSASIIHTGGTHYCGMIPKSELNRSKY